MVRLVRLVSMALLLAGCSGGQVDMDAFCEAVEAADQLVFESSLPVDSMAMVAAFGGSGDLSSAGSSGLSDAAEELERLAVDMDAAYRELGVIDPSLAEDIEPVRGLVAAQFRFLVDGARNARTGDEVQVMLAAVFGGGPAPAGIAEWADSGSAGFDRMNGVALERCGKVIDG